MNTDNNRLLQQLQMVSEIQRQAYKAGFESGYKKGYQQRLEEEEEMAANAQEDAMGK